MGFQYQQQDSNDPALLACSVGATLAAANRQHSANVLGTPAGSTPRLVGTGSAPGSDQLALAFASRADILPYPSWQGGEWLVRINVTTGNANVEWSDTYVCRADDTLSTFVTVGSRSLPVGERVSFGPTGVKTMLIEGQPQASTELDDRFYIACIFQIAGSGVQRFGYTPDQLIDTPLEAPVVTPSEHKGKVQVVFPRTAKAQAKQAGGTQSALAVPAGLSLAASAQSPSALRSDAAWARSRIAAAFNAATLAARVHSPRSAATLASSPMTRAAQVSAARTGKAQ